MPCPAAEELRAHLEGSCESERLERVARHVASCAPCRERLGALAGDMQVPTGVDGGDAGDAGEAFEAGTPAPSAPVARASEDQEAASFDAAPRLPGYEVLRCLGSGGQAVVWEAVQEATSRRVAIKVLSAGPHAGRRQRFRFQREMELVGQFDHPGIVRLHDSGFVGGQAYHVLQFVEGVTLLEHVRRAALPPRAVVRLFREIVDAVEHAHGKGVIHRDLKPQNVLVDAEGQPHLLDFGIARLIEDEPLTRTTDVLGTVSHASPEQLRDPQSVDVRTDVYSLGVMLYEALAGRAPHEHSGSIADAIHVTTEVDPPPPSVHVARLDGDLDAIVLKALEKDPGRRYRSAATLKADLERHLAGEPIEARRASRAYVARKVVAKHRWAFGAATAVAVVLVALVVALAGQVERVGRQRDRALVAETEARQQALRARETSRAVLDLLAPLGAATGEANDLTFKELLRTRAIHSRGARLSDDASLDRDVRVEVLRLLGRLYLQTGLPYDAAQMFRKAREVRRGAGLAPAIDDVRLLSDSAAASRELGDLAEAVRLEKEAQGLRRRLLPPGSPERVRGLAVLADLAFERGDRSEGERLLNEAMQAVSELSNPVDAEQVATWAALGRVLAQRHRDREAVPLLEAAIDPVREQSRSSLALAETLRVLARARARLGDVEGADRAFRESLAIERYVLGADALPVARHGSELAVLVAKAGHPLEARLLLEDALAVQRVKCGDDHPDLVLTHRRLAELLRSSFGQTSEADAHLAEAERMQATLELGWRAEAARAP